jgi:hypothetical protein
VHLTPIAENCKPPFENKLNQHRAENYDRLAWQFTRSNNVSKTGFINMRGWEKHQHYKDRNPPWVKLHKDLLYDYDFGGLKTASKAHVMLMWVLASQMDNKIPGDAEWIASRIGCVGDKINLKELILHGFINDDSNMLADCKQSATTETETETETKADNWSNDFDRWWSEYPKKVGKKPTKAIWKRITPNADLLITDIQKRLAGDDQWKSGFIPNPSTYLNQERWTDEIQVAQAKPDRFQKPDVKSATHGRVDFDAIRQAESMLDSFDPYKDMK